ncbi:MAG: radical SAM protein [Syntrophobacterales bacterium]|nr:radical SAM protein [Syntrophobacterales bacterium]
MVIYPIFLPFSGCPSRCIYCNQSINTLEHPVEHEKILEEVKIRIGAFKEIVLKNKRPGEIAFYGGTFTALPLNFIEKIVELLHPLCLKGIFTGVRFSTRPDAVTNGVLEVLRGLPISMVELGVQTLNNRLLEILNRGYTTKTVEEAVKKIQALGWKVGLQLMVGIPDEDRKTFFETVELSIALSPNAVRLYPLIVFPNTILGKWYEEARFQPLSLKEAILRCAKALMMFEEAGVDVIRIGLQSNRALDNRSFLAGPYHPAFGYLTRVHWWRLVVNRELEKMEAQEGRVKIEIPERFLSECLGPKQINMRFWVRKWALRELSIGFFNEPATMFSKRVYIVRVNK